mmetsp:Transcript_8270/g.30246  ORF Transcript_8270/g.30246 Transcript_8270/m.30246 type:complete len:324 (+) Transcript_8270:248-1219(+)
MITLDRINTRESLQVVDEVPDRVLHPPRVLLHLETHLGHELRGGQVHVVPSASVAVVIRARDRRGVTEPRHVAVAAVTTHPPRAASAAASTSERRGRDRLRAAEARLRGIVPRRLWLRLRSRVRLLRHRPEPARAARPSPGKLLHRLFPLLLVFFLLLPEPVDLVREPSLRRRRDVEPPRGALRGFRRRRLRRLLRRLRRLLEQAIVDGDGELLRAERELLRLRRHRPRSSSEHRGLHRRRARDGRFRDDGRGRDGLRDRGLDHGRRDRDRLELLLVIVEEVRLPGRVRRVRRRRGRQRAVLRRDLSREELLVQPRGSRGVLL